MTHVSLSLRTSLCFIRKTRVRGERSYWRITRPKSSLCILLTPLIVDVTAERWRRWGKTRSKVLINTRYYPIWRQSGGYCFFRLACGVTGKLENGHTQPITFTPGRHPVTVFKPMHIQMWSGPIHIDAAAHLACSHTWFLHVFFPGQVKHPG